MKIWKLKTVMTVRVNKLEACANWFNPFKIFKQLFPGPWLFRRNRNQTPRDKKNIRYFYIKMRLCNQFSIKVSRCRTFLNVFFSTFSIILVLKSNSDSRISFEIFEPKSFWNTPQCWPVLTWGDKRPPHFQNSSKNLSHIDSEWLRSSNRLFFPNFESYFF